MHKVLGRLSQRSRVLHASDPTPAPAALQALLNSLTPGAQAEQDAKLNPDQVRAISDKLGQLLGGDAVPDVGQRNEKGEVCPRAATVEQL